jgi:hypothetical protein
MKKFWVSCLALSFCLSFTSILVSYTDPKDCMDAWHKIKDKSDPKTYQEAKDALETCLVEDNWGITGTFFGDHKRASDRVRWAKGYSEDEETDKVLEKFQDNVSWRANAQWTGKWTTILGVSTVVILGGVKLGQLLVKKRDENIKNDWNFYYEIENKKNLLKGIQKKDLDKVFMYNNLYRLCNWEGVRPTVANIEQALEDRKKDFNTQKDTIGILNAMRTVINEAVKLEKK